MKQFIMTMGAPGSGKSTWAKRYIEEECRKFDVNIAYISRDEIRRVDTDSSNEYDGMIVDATHLNPGSRAKVISTIKNLDDYVRIAAVFRPSVETCLEQNHLREGRARVPDQVLISMYNSFIPPRKEEGFDFIWTKGEKEWKGVIE